MLQNTPRVHSPASPETSDSRTGTRTTGTSSGGGRAGRRRHAAPSRPNWTRRAGLVGGVVSAIALTGAAAPAMADGHGRHADETPSGPTAGPTAGSVAATSERAADAVAQGAMQASLAAERERAATQARKDSATLAAKRKAAVAAKAAKARATAAALAAARKAKLKASASTGSASAAPTSSSSSSSSSKADRLISFLKAQIGKSYVYGATGPNSYDCSGLTQTAYATVGVSLPRTSQEQSTVGTPVSLNSLQPGDLVFWGGEGSAYHVGVYIGDGNYLDAANPSSPVGIKPLTYSEPDWAVRVL